MKVLIIYSLPSQRMCQSRFAMTDDDTAEIAKMVGRGLGARGIETELLAIDENNISQISKINKNVDCIFNLIEWCGLDIELSKKAFSELRKLDLPVTGSSEKLFVLTGDKMEMKKSLISLNVPTPASIFFESGDEKIPPSFPYPVIVKPALEHCSMGLSEAMVVNEPGLLRAKVKEQMKTFGQKVLVEEFVVGRELLVYLVEDERDVRVLPIVEMFFEKTDGTGFQSYATKWDEKSRDYSGSTYAIAKLEPEVSKRIEDLAKRVFSLMGFFGYARFDLRLRDNIPYILETNANPSVYDATEEINDMEEEVIEGIAFADYLELIIKAAVRHYKRGEQV